MYLLDTSALYPLIRKLRENILDYSDKLTILDLTLYELGNTLWKEWKRGLIKDINKVTLMAEEILKILNKVSIQPKEIKSILKIALENDLTFYDSSYIYMAEKYNYKLVIKDNKILKTYNKAITINTLINKLQSESRHL